MSTTIKPVVYKTEETAEFLNTLTENIKKDPKVSPNAYLLLDHPAIYVHVWRSNDNIMNGKWSIYIGETINIIQRTKQHWDAAKISKEKRNEESRWQYHMREDVDDKGHQVVPTVYFFGHKLFHKSLTLDIENRLIDYCLAMETANCYNKRGNIQGAYYGNENLDDIFSMIWKILKEDNPNLFLSETSIKKSAIYKASPNHILTPDQKNAKQLIIDRVADAVLNNKTNQLIFVEGEAGTGKTVLTSSTFFDLIENKIFTNLSCYLLVNHTEQRDSVYSIMAKRLGYPQNIVQNPTSFLNNSSNKKADVVFVDEAHLLWATNTQGFNGKFKEAQLDEIMKRARVTVIMLDENQILHKQQIPPPGYIEEKRCLAKRDNNYISLDIQKRMNCSDQTMKWIDSLTKDLKVEELLINSDHRDSKQYEIRTFDSPAQLHSAIQAKARISTTSLSRLIATCDWQYVQSKKNNPPPNQKYWEIKIDDWSLPWNEQIFHIDMKSKKRYEKAKYRDLSWAEKDYSINEVGSTFTIQGFDLSFAGVILGPSIRYNKETEHIWFDETKRSQPYMKGKCNFRDGRVFNVTNTISQHELRVLMTRGTNGLYIYACDKDLREVLKRKIKLI